MRSIRGLVTSFEAPAAVPQVIEQVIARSLSERRMFVFKTRSAEVTGRVVSRSDKGQLEVQRADGTVVVLWADTLVSAEEAPTKP